MDYQAVLFDFDFTLADASQAILAGFAHGFQVMGHPAPEEEAVRRTIGLTLEDAYTRLSGDASGSSGTTFPRSPRPCSPL